MFEATKKEAVSHPHIWSKKKTLSSQFQGTAQCAEHMNASSMSRSETELVSSASGGLATLQNV